MMMWFLCFNKVSGWMMFGRNRSMDIFIYCLKFKIFAILKYKIF